eukprot:4941296-Ditylum_brightwellii.AAC.1
MACEPTFSKVLLEVRGNNVYELTTKKDTIEFYHAACFSPTKSMWKKAAQAEYTRLVLLKIIDTHSPTGKGYADLT